MTPLHRDPHFCFRFAEDRLIRRFHLDGIEPGRRVAVYRLDPRTGGPSGLLAHAVAGDGGWVDLSESLVVQAGHGFIAVPEAEIAIRLETPADHPAIREVICRLVGRDAIEDAKKTAEFAFIEQALRRCHPNSEYELYPVLLVEVGGTSRFALRGVVATVAGRVRFRLAVPPAAAGC